MKRIWLEGYCCGAAVTFGASAIFPGRLGAIFGLAFFGASAVLMFFWNVKAKA